MNLGARASRPHRLTCGPEAHAPKFVAASCFSGVECKTKQVDSGFGGRIPDASSEIELSALSCEPQLNAPSQVPVASFALIAVTRGQLNYYGRLVNAFTIPRLVS